MKISKGLKQAYELQDLTFNAALALKESLSADGRLSVTRDDASAIASLIKALDSCQERIRIHRNKPLPGSLKPQKSESRRRVRNPSPMKDIAPL